MRTSIALITPPTNEPVTLSELKSWMRLDGTSEDVLLTQLIVAARQEAEKYLRSALVSQTLELTVDLTGGLNDSLGDGWYDLAVTELYGALPDVIPLPYAPIQSITSVTTYDNDNVGTVYSSDNYTLDEAGSRLVLNYGQIWPSNMRQSAACVIRYVAGYGTVSEVPQAIKIAIMNYALNCYEQRGICDNTIDPLAGLQASLAPYRNYTI